MKTAEELLREVEEEEKERKKFKKQKINIKITKAAIDSMKKVEEDEKKENEKKEKEEKVILQRKIEKQKKEKYNKSLRKKFKDYFKKFKDKKFVDEQDSKLMKNFFASFLINGSFLSVSIFSIIKFFDDFGIYSILYGIFGFGITLWYIENNLLNFIKELKKKENIN